MERTETKAERLERLERRRLIELKQCPQCGAAPGQSCRVAVPHLARREQAIADGLYTP